MKYLKTYENLNKEPEIGDYVLVSIESVKNQIGQIVEKYKSRKTKTTQLFPISEYTYEIKFDIVKIGFYKYEIQHISKNKEDLEIILATNKYNI